MTDRVEILTGIRAIARFLRVGNGRILAMEKRGAPVVRDEKGVMRAEKGEMWKWFKKEAKELAR